MGANLNPVSSRKSIVLILPLSMDFLGWKWVLACMSN